MADEVRDFFSNLQEEVSKSRSEFEARINQFVQENDLSRKINVPRFHIRLWKFKGKPVQIPINWRYLISTPFIYGMIIPAVIWHLFIEIYQQICFRLFTIPIVNYREYFIYDRQLLSWLNPWEKLNCIYCSYVNNLIRYSSEIGGRTERYWCPIKYYRRIKHAHSQYQKFVSVKNSGQLRKQWEELRDFNDLT
jgi:hypothetical protein